MHRSAKELSPEELKQYRLRLNQHLQNRDPVDEALLYRAWQIACQVAVLLYENFEATQVAVFGSLAERAWFSKHSDIDIAVWGLPSNNYFRAVAETISFNQEFKIDLVRFENCKGAFRKRIQDQAVLIHKDGTRSNALRGNETHKMKWKKLIQRISEERTNVKRCVDQIREDLYRIEEAPVEYRKSLEAFVARHLFDFYKGLEGIFQRIGREVDRVVPKGEEWHKELLQQMTASRPTRPSVLSQETAVELQNLLGFRHVFIYIYADELDYEQVLQNAERVKTVFPKVSAELDIFITWLEQQI